MKKQLITMGAVGLAMAGMNSGACADEVQAHPAATPNAVQTEAKTLPQKTSTVPGTSMTTETRRRRKGNLKTPEPSWTAERTTSAGASRTLSRIMLHRRRWSRSSGNW